MTQQDRQRIGAWLVEGLPYAEIARRLDRTTSTVSREVGRNGGPAGYRAELAHRATERRARRRTPSVPPRQETGDAAARAAEEHAVEIAVGMGLPRMTARVLIALWGSDEGRLTAAELTRALAVSPASVSAAVGYLAGQGLIQRESLGRRDVYVVDDDAWYRSILTGAEQTLQAAHVARESAQRIGLDTPAGARLARGGAFLERVSLDTMESARRWRGLLA
ncbi:helix-turn-helix domain-containing protein [Catenulispora sp. NF23]|uniref:GbsR/MarR family transcriptional regulator n=1 Tax=Catenulispora pinistramenti TaxID=2705254 RepID=UPI001BA7832D|nr:helix-turn-helix domain-containing protein [Catenulispora pinistramenti]MBS2535174.1 helix-turn-helix domain-containing protein [Catenulispora pinistramenti]